MEQSIWRHALVHICTCRHLIVLHIISNSPRKATSFNTRILFCYATVFHNMSRLIVLFPFCDWFVYYVARYCLQYVLSAKRSMSGNVKWIKCMWPVIQSRVTWLTLVSGGRRVKSDNVKIFVFISWWLISPLSINQPINPQIHLWSPIRKLFEVRRSFLWACLLFAV